MRTHRGDQRFRLNCFSEENSSSCLMISFVFASLKVKPRDTTFLSEVLSSMGHSKLGFCVSLHILPLNNFLIQVHVNNT